MTTVVEAEVTTPAILQPDDIVVFYNDHDPEDPWNGTHVVVCQRNPARLIYGDTEHYSVFVPSLFGYSYAKASELRPMRSTNTDGTV